MEEHESKKKDLDGYLTQLEARQKNILWPDLLRGGRTVDEVFWKGTRKAPLVQRIGILIFAALYLLLAVTFVSMAVKDQSGLEALFAILLLFVGGRFIRNALRK